MAKGGQGSKSSPAMREAWKLFDAGDKLAARREAETVLAGSPSESDAAEAKDLIARTEPPPIFRTLAIGAAVLVATMVLIAILRG